MPTDPIPSHFPEQKRHRLWWHHSQDWNFKFIQEQWTQTGSLLEFGFQSLKRLMALFSTIISHSTKESFISYDTELWMAGGLPHQRCRDSLPALEPETNEDAGF